LNKFNIQVTLSHPCIVDHDTQANKGNEKDGCLLACYAELSGGSLQTFLSYGPDDGGSKTTETSVNFYRIAQRNNPEGSCKPSSN
jgi:hypothetical protein